MTQGFKPLKKAPVAGAKTKNKSKSAVARPKVGKRIAPKKQTALQEALQKRKNTASSTSRIEKEMAGRAQKGPLTIMRALANEATSQSRK